MQYRNTVSFVVQGRRALFSDPITRLGGEKLSYPIPTYQALKGITESIYWKPTLIWYIDRVRILNKICTETQNVRPIEYGGQQKNTLSIYTYLRDVAYQVEAHFEWNPHRPELAEDRNENKHHCIAKRMIVRGGRRDVFLGARECQGYVEPCVFGEGVGAYDGIDLPFGVMVHGFDYPDETGREELGVRLWQPQMQDGIIAFPRPEDCLLRRTVHHQTAKAFLPEENFTLCEALWQEEGEPN